MTEIPDDFDRLLSAAKAHIKLRPGINQDELAIVLGLNPKEYTGGRVRRNRVVLKVIKTLKEEGSIKAECDRFARARESLKLFPIDWRSNKPPLFQPARDRHQAECKTYFVPPDEIHKFIPAPSKPEAYRPQRNLREEVVEALEQVKPEPKVKVRPIAPKSVKQRKSKAARSPSPYREAQKAQKEANCKRILEAIEVLKAKGEPFGRRHVTAIVGGGYHYFDDYPELLKALHEAQAIVGKSNHAPPSPERKRNLGEAMRRKRREIQAANHQKVLDTLEALKAKGEPFCLKDVAIASGLSDKYLNRYPKLKKRVKEAIEGLKQGKRPLNAIEKHLQKFGYAINNNSEVA